MLQAWRGQYHTTYTFPKTRPFAVADLPHCLLLLFSHFIVVISVTHYLSLCVCVIQPLLYESCKMNKVKGKVISLKML